MTIGAPEVDRQHAGKDRLERLPFHNHSHSHNQHQSHTSHNHHSRPFIILV